MPTLVFKISLLLVTVVALAALTVRAAAATDAAASSSTIQNQIIPASDSRFVYEGRFDFVDGTAPVVIWQASRIRLDFEGDALELLFEDAKDQNFFNVEIDGRSSIAALRQSHAPEGVSFSGLGAGRHQLVLFKRSEAAAGTVRFRGVSLAAGAKAFAPNPTHYAISLLFVGDSITAGACNEDGATDQWEDRRTHNNALSYGALTAAAFNADYRNIAVSGMGVVIGWVPMKAGNIWDRVYPRDDSPRADLATWTPSVVFINLGENDDSFTGAKGMEFPSAAYTNGYVELVNAIRAAYPNAQIVMLRGGMFGGAQSERLRAPWEAAVKKIEAADPHTAHFVFKHWSQNHPRVSDDRAMADELIAWLKTQAFMSARD